MKELKEAGKKLVIVFLLNLTYFFYVTGQDHQALTETNYYLEYDFVLQNALSMQQECDSMYNELLLAKNRLRETDNENEILKHKASITVIEKIIKNKQEIVDGLFNKAQQLKPASNASETYDDAIVKLTKVVNGLKVFSYSLKDSTKVSNKILIMSKPTNNASKDNANKFEILSATPYSMLNPIPENEEIPEGLIYRIQLGVFEKKLPLNTFGGLSPLSAEILQDIGLTKYFVGYFISIKRAHDALVEVKVCGFDDAFVVSYFNKEKIAINKARELEFGQKLNTN